MQNSLKKCIKLLQRASVLLSPQLRTKLLLFAQPVRTTRTRNELGSNMNKYHVPCEWSFQGGPAIVATLSLHFLKLSRNIREAWSGVLLGRSIHDRRTTTNKSHGWCVGLTIADTTNAMALGAAIREHAPEAKQVNTAQWSESFQSIAQDHVKTDTTFMLLQGVRHVTLSDVVFQTSSSSYV